MALKETIENLKNSPIYQLTTSSMENTHSDFWHWLLLIYKEKALNIFNIEISEGEKIEECAREKKHFDLYVKTNKRSIVIENKIKSFYDYKQLKQYSAKNDCSLNDNCENCQKSIGNQYRLVTFFEELTPDDVPKCWKTLTYNDILKNIKKLNLKNDAFVIEYINVLENLLELFNNFNSDKDIYENGGAQEMEDLKEIRIDDIYKKFKAYHFEKHLNKALKKEFGKDLDSYSYFTSGQGAVCIKLKPVITEGNSDRESSYCVITLQGNNYKKEIFIGKDTTFYRNDKCMQKTTVRKKNAYDIKPEVLEKFENLNWFKDNGQLENENFNSFGLKEEQYDHLSKYKYFLIDKKFNNKEITYKELTDFIIEDIKKAYNDYDNLREILECSAKISI